MRGIRRLSVMACWLGAGVGLAVVGVAGWPLSGRSALGPPRGISTGVPVTDVGTTGTEVFERALSGYVEPIAWLGVILILLGLLALLVTTSLDAQRELLTLRVARAVGATRRALRGQALRQAAPVRRTLLLGAGSVLVALVGVVGASWALSPELDVVAPAGARFWFAASALTLAITVCLVAPHLRVARRARDLRSRRPPGRGAGASAVVLQVAVSAGLLYAAGVLWRSVATSPAVLATEQPADTLVTPLQAADCPGGDCGPALATLVSRTVPEVRMAASGWSTAGSVLGLGSEEQLLSECNGCFIGGMPAPRLYAAGRLHGISAGYFDAVRHPILRGRSWTPEEGRAGRVAILSEQLAQELFQDSDPIGQRLTRARDRYAPPGDWFEVVGLVADHWPGGIASSASRTGALYVPVETVESGLFEGMITVDGESGRDATALAFTPLETLIRAERRGPERLASGLVLLACLAMVLMACGTAGAVRLRLRSLRAELAIRRAVGASRGQLRRWVLADTVRLVAVGGLGATLIGWGSAAALAEFHRSVHALAPPIALGVAAVAVLVAIAVALPAAREAAAVDPARILE